MKNLDDLLGTVHARIGAGLALAAALVIGLPVDEHANFDPVKAMAIAAAASTWLWAELKSISLEPSPHDQNLFRKSHSLFDASITCVAEHDFGNSFNHAITKPFIEFVDQWKGPSYVFVDKKVNSAWVDFANNAQQFTRELVEQTGYMPNSDTILTVKTYEDLRQGGRSEQTLAAADKLNERADAVALAWSRYVEIALKRLRTTFD